MGYAQEAARIRRFLFVTERLSAPDTDWRGQQFFHTISENLISQVREIRALMVGIAADLDAGALTVDEAERRLMAVEVPCELGMSGHYIKIMWWPRWNRRVSAAELTKLMKDSEEWPEGRLYRLRDIQNILSFEGFCKEDLERGIVHDGVPVRLRYERNQDGYDVPVELVY